jgi:hypothetical protein
MKDEVPPIYTNEALLYLEYCDVLPESQNVGAD